MPGNRSHHPLQCPSSRLKPSLANANRPDINISPPFFSISPHPHTTISILVPLISYPPPAPADTCTPQTPPLPPPAPSHTARRPSPTRPVCSCPSMPAPLVCLVSGRLATTPRRSKTSANGGHRGAARGIDGGRIVVGRRRRRRGERVGRESVPVASDRPPAGPRGSPALHRCGRRLRRLRLRPGRRRRGGLLRRRWHSVGSVLHILQAVSPSGAVGNVVGGGFSQESYGLGGGREVGNIRMLVDKGRGVVDFVMDYEVEILERQKWANVSN